MLTDGVIGIQIAHLRAFGSGELKSKQTLHFHTFWIKKIKTCIEKSEDVMQLRVPKEINVCRIVDHILCTYLRNHFSRVEGMSTAAQNTLKLGQRS